jgi:hypothetical protein
MFATANPSVGGSEVWESGEVIGDQVEAAASVEASVTRGEGVPPAVLRNWFSGR